MNINNNYCKKYCGFIQIIGRTNVGKSTLFNKLVGKKISITSKKHGTTKCCILGVKTDKVYQEIYLDTPGFYSKRKRKLIFEKIVNINSFNFKTTLILFLIEGTKWSKEDQLISKKLVDINLPVIVIINKIDLIKNKREILSHINFLNKEMNFENIIPISIKYNDGLIQLVSLIRKFMTNKSHFFPSNYLTNCSNQFIISEIIREKLMRLLGDEVPYYCIIKVVRFNIDKYGNYKVICLILVKSSNHKKIIIGNQGKKIKIIKLQAIRDIESFFKINVKLILHIKESKYYYY